jgi:translation initiation factor IF-2
MRKRGDSLSDLGILVVAADDGVMPQTVEAVSHVRGAGVPFVVAINKIDKPGANLDKVKKELSEIELQPEEWGGKTVVVPVSALTGAGIEELLDMILLTADLNPPTAVFERPALASVIESRLDRNLGSIATVLIHTGTLSVGDYVVVGRAVGRVRRLLDFRNRPIASAGPAAPVTIVGLNHVPQAGDILQVVEEQEEARLKAASQRAPLKRFATSDDEDTRPLLALLLKADSQGSLEAIEQTVRALVPEEIRLSIIRSEVGNISDSDVLTAQAAEAIIYGFNVAFSGMAQRLADKEHVPVRLFNIIYRLSEDARREVEERLPVDVVRTPLGRLKVLKVFFSTPKRKIVGGEVAQGTLEPKTSAIIWRKEGGKTVDIGHGIISEMQVGKQSLQRAETGDQVGITYEGKGKIKEGDVLEVYKEEKVKRKLERPK